MRFRSLFLLVGFAGLSLGRAAPLELGTRLEPFFDDYLIAEKHGVALTLGTPQPEGTVIAFDQPWEGVFAGYVTVLKDGDKYRMYYRGWNTDQAGSELTCYAESPDGRAWTKPKLGLHEFQGSKDNNIILSGSPKISSSFSPFIDRNPAARPDEKYKAMGGAKGGLYALASADGIHWRQLQEQPVFTEGAFDSQNVPFWSEAEKCYVLYYRVWDQGLGGDFAYAGFRTIGRATSQDFIHWTKPELMTFGDAPKEHLYTNQTYPYYRAPHLYLSFAMRLMPDRQLLSADEARALGIFQDREKRISDGVFMTSRGGNVYDRTFRAAYFRPGPDRKMWVARNSMAALGVVPLGGGRMGIYRQHHYAAPTNHLVLYSEREDGIASLKAGAEEGYVVTKPFVQAGTGLWLNFATSAVGSVRVEVLDADGQPLPGYAGADAKELFGDSLAEAVQWNGGRTWGELAGKTVRLRFTLRDADLYSLQQR